MHKPLRTLVSAAIVGLLATSASQAGSFSIYTESAGYTAGNFGAGVAAEARDASTGWYNPAGLALIQNQEVVFAGSGIFPKTKLNGVSSLIAPPLPPYRQAFTDLDGAENGFVPAFHYALPLGQNATVGLSMVSPFGLSTDYGVYSPIRYQATFSELITTNLSPEFGARLSDNFAIGAGIDLQYARVKFNRILGVPNAALPLGLSPYFVDSLTYNKGHSYGVGFHAGVMAMFNDNHTRLGANYQSKMRHNFNGYSQLSGPLANPFNLFQPVIPSSLTNFRNDGLSSNPIEFPDVVTVSAYHDVNETLALLGSVVYYGWDVFKTLQLNGVAAPAIAANGTVSQVLINSASAQNYRNSWRASVGANYKLNQVWMLRVGGGYDQTPTNNIDRDMRLPDTDRWALAIGAHYQMKPNVGFDVGYTHLWNKNEIAVNRTDPLSPTSLYNVTATGKASADIVGAQVVWMLDQPAPVVATK